MKTFDECKAALEELTWAFAAGAVVNGTDTAHAMDGAIAALCWFLEVKERVPTSEGVMEADNPIPRWLATIRQTRAASPNAMPLMPIPEDLLPRPAFVPPACPKPSTN